MNDYLFAALAGLFVAVSLGFVWYAPFGLGGAFLDALGRRAGELDPREAVRPIAAALGALAASAVALAVLVQLTGAHSVEAGALVGGVAAAVVVAVMLSDYLSCGWPLRLFAIQASFRALFLVLVGAALAARP